MPMYKITTTNSLVLNEIFGELKKVSKGPFYVKAKNLEAAMLKVKRKTPDDIIKAKKLSGCFL